MTPAELEAIRARAERATPGPWALCISESSAAELGAELDKTGNKPVWWVGVPIDSDTPVAETANCTALTGNGPNGEANATFIAAARTDVVTLLAEVERLRREVEYQTAIQVARRLLLNEYEKALSRAVKALRWIAGDGRSYTDVCQHARGALRDLGETE